MSFSFPKLSTFPFVSFCFVKLDFPKVNAEETNSSSSFVFYNEKKKGGKQTNLAMDIGRQSRKRTTAWPASHSRRNKGDSTSLKEEETNQTKEKKRRHYRIGETTVFRRKYTQTKVYLYFILDFPFT